MYLQQGLLDKAIDLFRRAIAIAREIGDNPLVPEALANMGQAYAKKGDLLTARTLLQQSLASSETGGEIWYLCQAHGYLAEISLALGDEETAFAQAEQVLDITRRLGSPPYFCGTGHRVMGLVLTHAAANAANAEPAHHFEESLRFFREGGFRTGLARTLAAYSHYLLAKREDEEQRRGREMREKARALFRDMGMTWDLAMLDRTDTCFAKPRLLSVRLPLAVAPTGRPLRDDEWVEVIWNVSSVEDETIPGKAARRRHRLLRLLREASEQNAAPRVTDLARALDVTPRTIKRDLAALRAAGHDVHTRGSRKR